MLPRVYVVSSASKSQIYVCIDVPTKNTLNHRFQEMSFHRTKKRLVSRQYKIVVSPKGHSCTEKDFCRTELTEPTELSLLPRRPLCEYSLRHNLVDTTPGHRRSLLEQLSYFDIHE